MSHTQKISVSFVVSADVDGSRLMDDLIQHIQTLRGVSGLETDYQRSAAQSMWSHDSRIPRFHSGLELPPLPTPPRMQRQVAVSADFDPMTELRRAFPAPIESVGEAEVDDATAAAADAPPVESQDKEEDVKQLQYTLEPYKRAYLFKCNSPILTKNCRNGRFRVYKNKYIVT